jgi:hypothetical protein
MEVRRMNNYQEEENVNRTPSSDLDFQSLITSPVWGKSSATSKELRANLLTKKVLRAYKKGDYRINPENGSIELVNMDFEVWEDLNAWGNLGYLTQDLRLGNLNDHELDYIRETLDLAYAFLDAGMTKPFMWCLGEVAGITETSHAKGGWFRSSINTLRTENRTDILNRDDKVNFWGVRKK